MPESIFVDAISMPTSPKSGGDLDQGATLSHSGEDEGHSGHHINHPSPAVPHAFPTNKTCQTSSHSSKPTAELRISDEECDTLGDMLNGRLGIELENDKACTKLWEAALSVRAGEYHQAEQTTLLCYQDVVKNLHNDAAFLQAVYDYNQLSREGMTIELLRKALAPRALTETEQSLINMSISEAHMQNNLAYRNLPPAAPEVGVWDLMVLNGYQVPIEYFHLQLIPSGFVYSFDE
ncbi:hypothetical protein GQ53DRAFT_826045 [Thozetella sp. PMI_491]|nr:hypothetical protein GQ53DRAFT_826045 [Thozetella sp. PMI_491]